MISSFLGTSLCHIVFATYLYLNVQGINTEHFGWIPVTTFSLMLLIASSGVTNIPFLIVAEISPEKIRSIVIQICCCTSWAMVAVTTKLFPILIEGIGLHGCIALFGGCCIVAATFVWLKVPETNGKSFEEIQKMVSSRAESK